MVDRSVHEPFGLRPRPVAGARVRLPRRQREAPWYQARRLTNGPRRGLTIRLAKHVTRVPARRLWPIPSVLRPRRPGTPKNAPRIRAMRVARATREVFRVTRRARGSVRRRTRE